jgi:predicted hydrocarbon binding protein
MGLMTASRPCCKLKAMNNSILDELQFETGRLTFKEVRYLLIRPETLAGIQKALEAEVGPEKGAEILFAGGNVGGDKSARRYKEAFGYSDEEIVHFMCRMGGEIGWGDFRLLSLDVGGGELLVEVVDSPFAAVYGESNTAVCHLIRGVLAGLGAGLFEGDVEAQETACRALGDPACRFEITRRPSSNLRSDNARRG